MNYHGNDDYSTYKRVSRVANTHPQFKPAFVKGLKEFVGIPDLAPNAYPDYATNGIVI